MRYRSLKTVAVLESEQLPPVPATPTVAAVTTDTDSAVAVPATDVNPVAVAEEQGELLSLDGLKEEMQQAQNDADTKGIHSAGRSSRLLSRLLNRRQHKSQSVLQYRPTVTQWWTAARLR